jgi:hypothetical protein
MTDGTHEDEASTVLGGQNERLVMPMPCPFCGNEPEAKIIYGELEEYSKSEFAAVQCKAGDCQIRPQVGSTMVKGKALNAAIRRWNIRA